VNVVSIAQHLPEIDETKGPVDVAVNRAVAATRQIAWDADDLSRSDSNVEHQENKNSTKDNAMVDAKKVAPVGMWNQEGKLVPLPEKITASKKSVSTSTSVDEQIMKGVRMCLFSWE
jgi:hypothetical protein